MNITIVPGKAEEDVREIELIIDNIDKSMQELDEIIRRLIPERLETEWSNSLKENWTTYYNNSVQGAMEGMMQSAISLKNAVDAAMEYSK